MNRFLMVSAAAVLMLSAGGAAWANKCQQCYDQCDAWYDDPDQQAACKNGCAFACIN